MLDLNNEKCTGCHACCNICPKNCIDMLADREGFLYPHVDSESCVSCRLCEKTCPAISTLGLINEQPDPDVYAAHSKDTTIRQNSSSGGVFMELAKHVIRQGGVVFAAAFHDKYKVTHKFAENEEELTKFYGSKYVQSEIGNTYRQTRDFLQQGRLVLFTGTPCQIAGLRKYLGHPFGNLITQDIVCHGVPSPLVWERYVMFRESEADSKVRDVYFRDKSHGWKAYSLRLNFQNNKVYRNTSGKDPYMRAFLSNLSLRPSCYSCGFKGGVSDSDITLADFWGIGNFIPQMADDKGTSLVLINTNRGKEIFQKITDCLVCEKADADEAIIYNSSMVKSALLPENRNVFMERILCEPFDHVVGEMCVKPSFGKRVMRKLKRMLSKSFIHR